ncbi:unnamed protein product [Urochloa humidicola]
MPRKIYCPATHRDLEPPTSPHLYSLVETTTLPSPPLPSFPGRHYLPDLSPSPSPKAPSFYHYLQPPRALALSCFRYLFKMWLQARRGALAPSGFISTSHREVEHRPRPPARLLRRCLESCSVDRPRARAPVRGRRRGVSSDLRRPFSGDGVVSRSGGRRRPFSGDRCDVRLCRRRRTRWAGARSRCHQIRMVVPWLRAVGLDAAPVRASRNRALEWAELPGVRE